MAIIAKYNALRRIYSLLAVLDCETPILTDTVAPQFRVGYVPSEEDYLHMDFSPQGQPKTKADQYGECGTAWGKTLKQGMWVLVCQVSKYAT